MNLRESAIKRVVQLMKDPLHGLVIKDRTFHFHVFPDCFVGNEFVTWTLQHSVVDTREHGTMLGQDLLDRGVIYHASNDQPFKDGYFFYTFQKFPEISDAEMDIIVIRMKAHPTGVSIQDRSHHLRNYKDCFVGKEAVDWFVNNIPQHAPSRAVAVKLGQELMNKGVAHSANQQAFADSGDFYYFQKPVFAGYLGKLTKTATDWKIRWFAIKDIKEKKLWYFNSPRDPVPRDFIPLTDACVRVSLDQEIASMEICTPLRIFTLRPTSSTLLARWVRVLSEFIGCEGTDNNLRMELAERSVSVHESRVSSKLMRERRLVTIGPSLGEVVASGLIEGLEQQQLTQPKQPPPPTPSLSLEQREQHDSSSSSSSRHDSTRSENPLSLSNLPETFETLDLMYDDDLDIDLDDELFPPIFENGNSDALETKFEDGLIGEANFVSPEGTLHVDPSELEDGTFVFDPPDGDTEIDQQAALSRLKQKLQATYLQDYEYIPPTASLSMLPPMFDDEGIPPKEKQDKHRPNNSNNQLDFHIV